MNARSGPGCGPMKYALAGGAPAAGSVPVSVPHAASAAADIMTTERRIASASSTDERHAVRGKHAADVAVAAHDLRIQERLAGGITAPHAHRDAVHEREKRCVD